MTILGLSTFPPAQTAATVKTNLTRISGAADLISFQADAGVPWATGGAIPSATRKDWETHRAIAKGKKILLSLTPLNEARDGIADQLGGGASAGRLDDPAIAAAYARFVLEAVEFWRPDWLVIGLEVNLAPFDLWAQYVTLHMGVRELVRKRYPALPVAASIQVEAAKGLKNDAALQQWTVPAVIERSDFVALSTYPYAAGIQSVPADYFKPMFAHGKPVAVTECGWTSKPFSVGGVKIPGSQAAQKQFVGAMLRPSFLFVVNWLGTDFDALLTTMPKAEAAWAKAWAWTGLWDAQGKSKAALAVWNQGRK